MVGAGVSAVKTAGCVGAILLHRVTRCSARGYEDCAILLHSSTGVCRKINLLFLLGLGVFFNSSAGGSHNRVFLWRLGGEELFRSSLTHEYNTLLLSTTCSFPLPHAHKSVDVGGSAEEFKNLM